MENTFAKILAPLKSYLELQGNKIDKETGSRSLTISGFTTSLLYGFLTMIPSLRQLVTDLETNGNAEKIGLKPIPFSTLKDGFSRFPLTFFKGMYKEVLGQVEFLKIDGFEEHGKFRLVDGSIFPNISSMTWAKYKKTKNAIRLHLSFNLNKMIPSEFLARSGNSCERTFLREILEKGMTYIADRGYFSFAPASEIQSAGAFFIFRIKENILYEVGRELAISTRAGKKIPACFSQIEDCLAKFTNDSESKVYRIVSFNVMQSRFVICTNRLNLTTLEIIILYAMRWQVELLFKFIKRTMNGIHLFNLSEKGVNINFYLLMTAAILKLGIKQQSVLAYRKEIERKQDNISDKQAGIEAFSIYDGYAADQWIRNLTDELQDFWKIGIHWTRKMINLMAEPFDYKVIAILGKT